MATHVHVGEGIGGHKYSSKACYVTVSVALKSCSACKLQCKKVSVKMYVNKSVNYIFLP